MQKPIDKALDLISQASSVAKAIKDSGCSAAMLMRVLEHENKLVHVEGFKQRKTVYEAARLHKARQLMQNGKCMRRAAVEAGLCESTIYRWALKLGIAPNAAEAKEKQLSDWRKTNPAGTKSQAARALGWGISKIYRYWK